MSLFLTIAIAVTPQPCVSTRSAAAPTLTDQALKQAFRGGKAVNLARSKNPTVVTLREVVKIPPPHLPVLVKTFRKESLPDVLRPAFANPNVSAVTICGRYIAITETSFPKEHQDILNHELVHAYITLASPRALPFWFQEGSAVYFSIDAGQKFYGKPAEDDPRATVGKTVDLPEIYKNKLQNFHYLIEKVGQRRFYQWYRDAVTTGVVNPRLLLGITPTPSSQPQAKGLPVWAILLASAAIIIVTALGLYILKREMHLS